MADLTTISGGNRETLSKMLLTMSPTVSTTTTASSLPSPTGETDENPNKLISYLHQLAGNYEIEVDVIMKDHCYARPWNWKPENVYVKPVKKLFFTKNQSAAFKDKVKMDDFVNVEEGGTETPVPPYDLSKARQSMDEFQRVANFVKQEDTDDWEEKIDKILWSTVQNRIFNRTVRLLNSERIARLAKANSLHEPILRRTSTDMTAKRFRETLASANWDWRITQWLHSLLFDYLPQEYLAIYLDILQTLRQKIPQLIDKMIAVQPNINSKGNAVMWETLNPVLKKSWDPISPVLNANKPKKLPGNPILVIAPSGMSSNISSRQHKWISQLGYLGMVVTVNSHLGLTANRMTMMAGVEQLVQASRSKIQDIRVDYPGRPIILIGFNTGAALACQLGQLEHVTAVVCLGFPFNTVDGKRGYPDDSLLDVRCPVMFIIGQNSMLARVDDIEDLRERMLVPTSLVVVGSADDHLRISTSKKISEKISQSMVDRCILDEIGDFVGGILLQPHPLPLRAPNTINSYENRGKRITDGRKRKTSTSSSVESEPQSPNLKKLRPHSPQEGITVGNNMTNLTTNALPRGTLVTLTGTASTQTPKRKPRSSFANQNFSDQLITSRLSTQQQNLDSNSGGITLNIGSFASLAPVGPIRFEPTSISLQTSTASKISSPIKPFIKVSKNTPVTTSNQPNVPKIKMLMPTKKVQQRTVNNYKNTSISDKTTDINLVNVLTSSSTSLKIHQPSATVTNPKASTANTNNMLPSIHNTKNLTNAGSATKSAASSSILFTPKNDTVATTTSTTSTKVADISMAGDSRKHTIIRGNQQDQLSNSNNPSSLTGLNVIPKSRSPKSRPVPKISIKSLQNTSTSKVQMPEKNLKMCTGSTDTTLEYTPMNKSNVSTALDDDLGNILDIPIIIAKDGENLNSLERLSPLPQVPITLQSECKNLPVINSVGNKVVFINNRNMISSSNFQQSTNTHSGINQIISNRIQNPIVINQGITSSVQPTIKYTKIILTKRSDQEEKNNPVTMTKCNRRVIGNKLLVVDSKNDLNYSQGLTRISNNSLNEQHSSTKDNDLSILNSQYNSNSLNPKQSFLELNLANSKS